MQFQPPKLNPITGVYAATQSAAMSAPHGPANPQRALNIGGRTWTKCGNTADWQDGWAFNPATPLSLPVDLCYLSLTFALKANDEKHPISKIAMTDNGFIADFTWQDCLFWNGVELQLPAGAEFWINVNPSATWPSFWGGNMRPQSASAFIAGAYV